MPKHLDSSLQQADMWDLQPISRIQGQLTCLMKGLSPQVKGVAQLQHRLCWLLLSAVECSRRLCQWSLVPKRLPQQPQDVPCDGSCDWCLRKHLATSLAILMLQRSSTTCWPSRSSMIHSTSVMKSSTEPSPSSLLNLGSGWRRPWGVEPFVAAQNIRGSHHCHMLSS